MNQPLITILAFAFTSTAFAVDCLPGYFPVRAHDRNAYVKSDGTDVSATSVNEQCRPYRVLRTPEPIFLSGRPDKWPDPHEKFRPWTKLEEQQIRAILTRLPRSLTHVGRIELYRSSGNSPNPAVSSSAGQIVVLYNSAASYDLRRVLAHELAHFMWDKMSSLERDAYYTVAEWRKTLDGTAIELKRKHVNVADSYLGPHEDFSNNLELFLSDRNQLKPSPKIIQYFEGQLP